jgi:hypothetical protein
MKETLNVFVSIPMAAEKKNIALNFCAASYIHTMFFLPSFYGRTIEPCTSPPVLRRNSSGST